MSGIHLGLGVEGSGSVGLEDEGRRRLFMKFRPQLEKRVNFVGAHGINDRGEEFVDAGILFAHTE